nr:S-layer homology domain-containing protein [uncultured Agathobaculum sp.]
MKRRLFSTLLAFCTLLGCTISVRAVNETGFSDVPLDAWYADAVAFCHENGLMSGTTATTFSPNDTMTRGMLVTVLYREAGAPSLENENLGYPFADVPGDLWYANGVYWARLKGITSGYADNRFGPNDPVTREQLAVILWRSAGSPAPEAESAFADQSSISAYAVDAVRWARESGIVRGKDGNRFDPAGQATRAETAAILTRWIAFRQNG